MLRLLYRHRISSGLGILPISIIWLWQKQIESYLDTKFPDLPYGWLLIVLVAIVIGGFLSDAFNPVSWVREKWSHWRRIFDVKGQYYSHDVRNEREYLYIRVRVTFARNIENADLLLKVYQIQMLPGHQFTHTIAEGLHKKKDAQETYTLAVVPLGHSENSYWGSPEKPTNQSLVDGGRYIVSLCLRTPKAYQEHKLYVEIATPKARNFAKYFVFDEKSAELHYLMKPTVEKDGCLLLRP